MLTILVDNNLYPVLDLPGRPKAFLDRTIAEIYGVQTREVNQAVRNNPEKFPNDFCFQLTQEEYQEVIKIFDHLHNIKYSRYLPKAFSHYGCNMLATILKSEVAVRRSVQIITAFTALEAGNLHIIENLQQLFFLQSQIISSINNSLEDLKTSYRSTISSIEQRLKILEAKYENFSPAQTISTNQAHLLKVIVKEKSQNRKKTMKIWSLFKRKFDLTRYVHLPKENFQEALQWLKQLEI